MKNLLPPLMTAVFVNPENGHLYPKKVDVPVPKKGEVLIKMLAAPINPSDLAKMREITAVEAQDFIPGIEGCGVVIKAGKGLLPGFFMGKRVACSAKYRTSGTWAEYMVTNAASCVPLSQKISMEQGSMLFVNPMTALAFFDLYRKTPNPSGKTRGIINTAAASALGQMIIRLGKQQNISVISVVRRDEQVEMLKNCGAEFVFNSANPDFEIQLKELAHRLNATIIFDAVGGDMPQKLLSAAPKGSSLFIYGRLSGDACEILPGELIFTGNQIKGFWLTHWLHEKGMIRSILTIRKVQSLIGNELGTTIHQQFPPEKISEAIETYTNNMSKGKVLLEF